MSSTTLSCPGTPPQQGGEQPPTVNLPAPAGDGIPARSYVTSSQVAAQVRRTSGTESPPNFSVAASASASATMARPPPGRWHSRPVAALVDGLRRLAGRMSTVASALGTVESASSPPAPATARLCSCRPPPHGPVGAAPDPSSPASIIVGLRPAAPGRGETNRRPPRPSSPDAHQRPARRASRRRSQCVAAQAGRHAIASPHTPPSVSPSMRAASISARMASLRLGRTSLVRHGAVGCARTDRHHVTISTRRLAQIRPGHLAELTRAAVSRALARSRHRARVIVPVLLHAGEIGVTGGGDGWGAPALIRQHVRRDRSGMPSPLRPFGVGVRMATGAPSVRPCRTPPVISTSSCSASSAPRP
jgi:hypothetical protein